MCTGRSGSASLTRRTGRPLGPAGPCGPAGPAAPVLPVAPAGPAGPAGPGRTRRRPRGPAGPAGPCWPSPTSSRAPRDEELAVRMTGRRMLDETHRAPFPIDARINRRQFRSTAAAAIFFAPEFPCASATLAAPATRAPITAPKTVDFILPPEDEHIRKHIKFGATAEVRIPSATAGSREQRRSSGPSGWVFRRGTGRPHLLEDGTRTEIVTSAIPTRYWKNRPSTPDAHQRRVVSSEYQRRAPADAQDAAPSPPTPTLQSHASNQRSYRRRVRSHAHARAARSPGRA